MSLHSSHCFTRLHLALACTCLLSLLFSLTILFFFLLIFLFHFNSHLFWFFSSKSLSVCATCRVCVSYGSCVCMSMSYALTFIYNHLLCYLNEMKTERKKKHKNLFFNYVIIANLLNILYLFSSSLLLFHSHRPSDFM